MRSSTTFAQFPANAVIFAIGLCLAATTGGDPVSGLNSSTTATAATLPLMASDPATTATTSLNSTTSAGPAPAKSYVLTDANGVQCATISCAFSFTIPYNTTDGTSNYIFTPPCSGEAGVSITGTCGSEQESIAINFTTKQWLLRFDVVTQKSRYFFTTVYLGYAQDAALFPNASEPGKAMTYNASGLNLFDTPYGSYYSCQADATQDLGHGYFMKTHQLEILAFTNSSSTAGLPKTSCDRDRQIPDNTVPIAVGASLAALVVIVVVAYFISRRTMRGYHSV